MHSIVGRLSLFSSFVDLGEKAFKDTFLQPFTLINRVDGLSDLTYFLIFILAENALQIHLIVHLLDFSLCRLVLSAVIIVESLSLLRVRVFEGFIYEP